MNAQVIIATIYSGAFLLLFATGELLFHGLKLKAEVTRKVVHIFTGLICLSFPLFVTTHWVVLFLTISFALILSLSIKFDFLKSINAVDRKTSGSYLFPVSIYMTWWAYSYFGHNSATASDIIWSSETTLSGILNDQAGIFYFLPLLIFSLSDPVAAMVGKTWPIGKYTIGKQTKTLAGSSGFFITAALISWAFCASQFSDLFTALWITLLIAITTTVAEGLSQRGFDNIFVPATAILMLFILK